MTILRSYSTKERDRLQAHIRARTGRHKGGTASLLFKRSTSVSQAPRHRSAHKRSRRPTVTVVTKKSNSSPEWFLDGDIRVRFPSKRLVLSADEQQQIHIKNKGDNGSRILTHDGHNSPTIIPTRHVGNESIESSLHKFLPRASYSRARTVTSSRRYSETTLMTFTKISSSTTTTTFRHRKISSIP